jgi:UDP-N-acetylmuramate--alanine ligase
VEFVGTIDRAVEAVLSVAGEGDLVITQGAGNVWQAGERVLERLRAGK